MEVEECDCGIEYECENPVAHLEKVNANAAGNKIPCKMCVDIIVDNTTKESNTCFVCETNFKKKRYVVQHIITVHVKSAPYKCEHCDTRVNCKKNLRTHQLNIHFGGDKVKCDFCDQVLGRAYLQTHIDNFHSKNRPKFLCQICGEVFSTSVNYKYHSQLHEGKKYKCPFCDKMCESKARLIWHKSRVHSQKPKVKKEPVNCEFCGKKYSSKWNLTLHMRNTHDIKSSTVRPKFRCQHCDKVFKTKPGVTEHESATHDVGKVIYACEICEKSFSRSAALYRHVKIHSGEKKHKCDTCGVSFNQKCSLTRHQVVHTGEKPFECGICGQRFTQKPAMKAHEKAHDTVIDASKKKTKKNKLH